MATNIVYFCFLTFAALTSDELYMTRCLQLALLGQESVAPNPMVGAVLVYDDRIIGEGYHQCYGEPHAEVHCLNSVRPADRYLIPASTLYVSLEPCAHFGKTPPCAELIVREKIKHVVVAASDPFARVNGKGFDILKNAGISVKAGILEPAALELNKCFFTFHQKRRPHIILKWAQTADGFIAGPGFRKVGISNPLSNRWVHKLRGTTQAIMVGHNTAAHDDPSLTTRLWPGKNPLRIVIDKKLQLPVTSNLFSNGAPLLVMNSIKDDVVGHVRYMKVAHSDDYLSLILQRLHLENINSLMVEGGSILLQSFIEAGLWDETIIITNKQLHIYNGIAAIPSPAGFLFKEFSLAADHIQIYKNLTA